MVLIFLWNPYTAMACPRQKLIHRESKLIYMQRIIDFGILSSKWEVSITLLISKFRDYCGRGNRKIIKPEVVVD